MLKILNNHVKFMLFLTVSRTRYYKIISHILPGTVSAFEPFLNAEVVYLVSQARPLLHALHFLALLTRVVVVVIEL